MKKFSEWLEVRESWVDSAAEAGYHAVKHGVNFAKKAAGAVGSAVNNAKYAMMSPEQKKRHEEEQKANMAKNQDWLNTMQNRFKKSDSSMDDRMNSLMQRK